MHVLYSFNFKSQETMVEVYFQTKKDQSVQIKK